MNSRKHSACVYVMCLMERTATDPLFFLTSPTYPGEFDGTKHHYTLSYPGLSLVFPIPEKHMLLYQSSAGNRLFTPNDEMNIYLQTAFLTFTTLL